MKKILDIIREARDRVWTTEERREAAISFVYANVALSDPRVTEAMVRKAFDDRDASLQTSLSSELVSKLSPGQHIVLFSDDPSAAIDGRRFGLELRDTFLILLPNTCRYAFLLRAPIDGSVTDNVLKHGLGALNIDACRVPCLDAPMDRWPANLLFIHDPACTDSCISSCPVAVIDAQTGVLKSGKVKPGYKRNNETMPSRGGYHGGFRDFPLTGFGDSGFGSRFFSQFRNEEEMRRWFRILVGA